MHRFVGGAVATGLLFALGCGGGAAPGGGEDEPAELCSAAGILAAIKKTNDTVGSVSQFGCKHGHAFAKAHFDCEGCVPELMYFFAEKSGEWEMVGLGHDFDPSMCEESRVMSFDECGELFEAFESSGK